MVLTKNLTKSEYLSSKSKFLMKIVRIYFSRWVGMVQIQKVGIFVKDEYIADEKSERLLFEWTVQIGKVSIFFEINVADEKCSHLSSIWYLRW